MSVARRRRKSITVNASSARPSCKGRLNERTTRPLESIESRELVPRRGQRVEQHRAVGVGGREHTVGTRACAWQLRLSIDPKRCANVTAPQWGSAMPSARPVGAARRTPCAGTRRRPGRAGRHRERALTELGAATTTPTAGTAQPGGHGRRMTISACSVGFESPFAHEKSSPLRHPDKAAKAFGPLGNAPAITRYPRSPGR